MSGERTSGEVGTVPDVNRHTLDAKDWAGFTTAVTRCVSIKVYLKRNFETLMD